MRNYYVDLHIHLGRTASFRPVKITGAKTLTIPNILHEAAHVKGLHMIGIIDCHVPEVLDELERGVEEKGWKEYDDGGVAIG
ncbi:MAG: TIGR00375 family protein, partial [Bacillaceae bacterium]|nr:TIGR00375 family protein [Bacillaceae bacterium]